MIQRIQTIWLFLASLCTFLTLKFPFYSGSTAEFSHVELNGQFNIPLMILTVISGTVGAVSIFLFKNRKVQMRVCIAALLLQIGCIALYINALKQFTAGTFALWSILSFLVVIFYIMAIMGINKDQKLIKSLNRLR